ncbi:MAG: hypothetical protein IPP69_11380 [Flavobacteriales bacterium]|nr:hypothetical protein [Flavobacteriales bacterium]
MSATIDVIISPIDEAVEAIIECIKEAFLKDLDKQFIPPEIESRLADYVDELKDDLFCLIEYPYVDKVYRDSFYEYYSSKHYSYQRDCIRVSIFKNGISAEDFLDSVKHDELSKKYLGFFIIRPTMNALFGRSIIHPNAFEESDFKICTCSASTLVFGVKLTAVGFPHSSQDGETLKCAETTIWSIMEYFSNRYAEYKPTLPATIHKTLARFSYQRQLPSNGLTMDQISFALKEFGFGTRIYSDESYAGDEIYKIIDCYIESGIPVLIGLEGIDVGHVIIGVGKQVEDFEWKDIDKSTLTAFGKETSFYDASDLPSKYIIQDDNFQPYRIIKLDNPGEYYADEDCKAYKIDSVVVPLYPRIYLEAVVAKNLALQVIGDLNLGYEFSSDFVFRFFLASSRSFKNHVSRMPLMDQRLKENLLITRMPKFIWCAEIFTQKNYEESNEALGLLILDATEANRVGLDAFIFAGYPDRCISMNENDFISLPLKFKNYTYYSNLK